MPPRPSFRHAPPPPPPPPGHGPHHPPHDWHGPPVRMLSLREIAAVADFDDPDVAEAMYQVLDEQAPEEWAAFTYIVNAMFTHLNRRLDAITTNSTDTQQRREGGASWNEAP